MNILSSRLHNALVNPVISSIRKSSAFYPSSASLQYDQGGITITEGTCLRQSYYRMTETGITNKGIPDYGISADIGEKLHQLIEEYVDQKGFMLGLQKIAAEHSFYDPETNVSGRSDLICYDHYNSEMIGIEVKSVGEYKGRHTMEGPAPEHVLQCMLYLDFYNRSIPDGQKKIEKWYIWYISRTENYSIKAKKHGGPLQMMWDYYITIDDDGCPVIHGAHTTETWKNFNIEKIKSRYSDLQYHLDQGVPPPRDFEIQYSEERIAAEHAAGRIARKMDREKVAKWLSKGAPEGKLKLELGDFACQLCAYKDHCWAQKELEDPKRFNFPQITSNNKQPPPDNDRKLLL